MQKHSYSAKIGDHEIVLETGTLAKLAAGSVTVRSGDSVLLATATSAKPREGIDFFPLSVDFEERLYAAGRIPGSFMRREGRLSDGAILISRLIDRPLRPLFPKGFMNEVQVIVTALARDPELHLDILGIIGAERPSTSRTSPGKVRSARCESASSTADSSSTRRSSRWLRPRWTCAWPAPGMPS